MQKLKPVTFVKYRYSYHRNNNFQQNLLLKALQVTSNPNELRKMAGLRTVADVYRTLDKLALRKEYHEALARQGLSLDVIVEGIKNIISTTKQDKIKLAGYQTLLRSLGLDKYDKAEESTKSWEEILLQTEEEKRKQLGAAQDQHNSIDGDYEVIVPATPENEKIKEEEELEAAKFLYEGRTIPAD